MRITLRGWFVLVFVTFSLVVTAAVGFVSWWIARGALEQELDTRLRQVAGAAAETGLQSSLVLALEPGDEYLSAWTSTHQRLARAMERMRGALVQRDEQRRLMVAQVAHEIRNPLGGLELFAAVAAETDDPVERRRLIGRIRDEVGDLNRIIGEFLLFARPLRTAGEIIDLCAPLREAAELAEGEVRAAGGALEVELPAEPLPVRVDPDHVKRATLNLLRNASQAGRRVRLEAEWKNGEAVVSVLDDGPGVAPQNRSRIFEPFVTDKERGAGFGLAIVKKVVDGMGGRIEVGEAGRPGFGKGACFRLYFPGSEDLPATVRQPEPRPEPSPVSV